VNPVKGFTGRILEFAKQLFHVSGVSLTPVGSKILLRSLREPIYFVGLLSDLINKQYLPILELSLSTFKHYLKFMGKTPESSRAWLFAFLGPQSGLWGQSYGNLDKNLWRSMFDQFLFESFDEAVKFSNVTGWYENRLLRLSIFSYSSVLELGETYIRVAKYSTKPWIWPGKVFEKHNAGNPEILALLTCASSAPILFPILLWYYLSALSVGLYLATVSKLTGSRGLDTDLLEAAKNPISAFLNYIARNAESGVQVLQGNHLAFREQYSNYLDNPFLRKRATKWPIHTDIGWFVGWLGTLKFKRPMQLLNLRFVRTRGLPADDCLPVVKTARACLSALSPEFRRYRSKTIAIEQQKMTKKNVKGGNKIL
jgi:hypothetical protein